MVASKTSIFVAAVALGAITAYAAPTTFNKDIALSRREADKSALIAREFDDDELYAREFHDDLDARDFEDDALEARDFDDDDLYARELYEDELEARELYEDELEARDFEDFEDFFARAVEATPPKNSTSTPSSTATSSTSTPSSTSTGAAKNDEHVLAATPTSTTTPSPTSTAVTDEEDHKHHHICRPYVKAYKILVAQFEHKSHQPNSHKHDNRKHDHHHHRHHHHHHHHHHRHRYLPSAHKIEEKCGREIAALVKLAAQEHGKAADTATAHLTESKTLNVHPVSVSGASGEKSSGPPATPDSAAPRVLRRSLGDDVYWKRSLAGSLGLDLDYFVKRFYDEDGFEY